MNKKATFAGGCFWGMEELFRTTEGVVSTVVGYTGGDDEKPSYENHPGHAEALEVTYDYEVVSYTQLLDLFFRIHNPTTLNRQGNDVGTSYRSAIFYSNEEEEKLAENFIQTVNESKRWEDPVVTTLEELGTFTAAEDFHQDYLQKNPDGYTCHVLDPESYLL